MLSEPKKTKDAIVEWIRNYFAENGPKCSAVVGISGGKDSTIVAALCVEALGKDRVFGVLMPDGCQVDGKDSLDVCATLDIKHLYINIRDSKEAITRWFDLHRVDITEQAKINLPPRLRMAALYAVAQCLPNGGRVANTCNRSEDYVGYSTKYGDAAGDFSPLSGLLVSEVKQIGYELPIPRALVDKTPSDGLCGKTDEDNLGFTYAQLDAHIKSGTCGVPEIDNKIETMHQRNLHKLRPMPHFEI